MNEKTDNLGCIYIIWVILGFIFSVFFLRPIDCTSKLFYLGLSFCMLIMAIWARIVLVQMNSPRVSKREIFLFTLASVMSTLAKCDGYIDEREISAIENSFHRLGLTSEERVLCIHIFRNSLREGTPINKILLSALDYGIATGFWKILYDILWDIACADGRVTESEKSFLREVAMLLGAILPPNIYEYYYQARCFDRFKTTERPSPSLERAYALLGISESATNEELKKAYRLKVKQLHPDILRAQGLPDSLLGRANKLMAQLNTAWDLIRSVRNIH